jgi:hypothetical protein
MNGGGPCRAARKIFWAGPALAGAGRWRDGAVNSIQDRPGAPLGAGSESCAVALRNTSATAPLGSVSTRSFKGDSTIFMGIARLTMQTNIPCVA